MSSIFESSTSQGILKSWPYIVCSEEDDSCNNKNIATLVLLSVWLVWTTGTIIVNFTCYKNKNIKDKIADSIVYGLLAPITLCYAILSDECCRDTCKGLGNCCGEVTEAGFELASAIPEALERKYREMPVNNYSSNEEARDRTRRNDESRQFSRELEYRR